MTFRCRLAEMSDVPKVAHIHVAAFSNFFLTQLGFKFLCVMYRAFLCSEKCIFVVAESANGQLAGFAVGVLMGQKDRALAVRFFPQFLVAVVPAVMRHPVTVVKRLCMRFFDECDSPQLPPDAIVLRSIGVLPTMLGLGAAADLLQTFEAFALSKGTRHVYLTTDELNNERAQRFYTSGGYSLVSRFQQGRKRWMWLMSKNLKEPACEC